MAETNTTVLIILDGWGLAPPGPGNAITTATAPNFFAWLKKYPHTALQASGSAVGLFKGQKGNSEAGHLNIGAGRVVKQDALYISEAIADGTFFKNPVWRQVIRQVKKHKSSVHLMGLLSNHNRAHSNPEHLYNLIKLLRSAGLRKIYLHLFTDGRDSPSHSARLYLEKLQPHLVEGEVTIATVMGRLYAMDRNKNWPRTKQAYRAIVDAQAQYRALSADAAVEAAYARGESDEFIAPTIIMNSNRPVTKVADNDAVIFFNLRSDRARQLTKVFVQPNFTAANPDSFKRGRTIKNLCFAALTDFGPDLPGVLTAFPSRDIAAGLTAALCPRRQLYVAESEKYAHITYFFNGGYAQHFCDEQWVKIASATVPDFKTDPAIKAKEIGRYVSAAIKRSTYEFIAINFANADMLGHTDSLSAARIGVGAVDKALAVIVKTALQKNSKVIITADHGNAEEMLNPVTNQPDTEHSGNPVPFILIASPSELKRQKLFGRHKLAAGKLADVAPTILKLMNIPKPRAMTGRALFYP